MTLETGGRGAGKPLSRGVVHLGWIKRTLKDLQGARTVIRELIQNADDAPGATQLRFEVTAEELVVWNDGVFERCGDPESPECEWLESERAHRCDFHSFRAMSSGDKQSRQGVTGAFGIGFTAVYQITDRPVLRSNGFRWEMDELQREDERIRSWEIEPEPGTVFELPWAKAASVFRTEIGQHVVADADVVDFGVQLLDEVPHSLLFLHTLDVIEAVVDGVTHRFERTPVEGGVLIGDGSRTERWVLLEGDLEGDGAALLDRYPALQQTRSTVVRVAVHAEELVVGQLYATLPTKEPSHLPAHVDGSFYPVSDRKRIDFDDGPQAKWNAAVLTAAARLFADNLEDMARDRGDALVTGYLLAANQLHERAVNGDVPTPFAVFWDTVSTALPSLSVVPRQSGGHGPPADVRLWSDPVEGKAASALADLGIELVEASVTNAWWELQRRKVPIRQLRLDHLVAGCRATGLTERRERSSLPGSLAGPEGLKSLWDVAELLATSRSSAESLEQLRDCSISPATDGAIWPLCETDRFEPELLDALHRLGAQPTVLDIELLGPSRVALLGVTDEVQAWQVVEWAEVIPADDVDESAASLILAWLHDRRNDLKGDEPARLSDASIFPTAAGRRPLCGLALPGEFEDPLGMAGLIDLAGVAHMAEWFHVLGAEPLTLSTYCTSHLPSRIEAGDLTAEEVERVVRFLATHRYDFADDAGVLHALAPLPIVLCTDGHRRAAERTYLPHDHGPLLPDHIHVAELPERDRNAHRDLYEWLGAAVEPRPEDVVVRCREVEGGSPRHREITEAVLKHLRDVLEADDDGHEYQELRALAWLPVRGHTEGVVPQAVHRTNREYLFASQGSFIDLPRVVENDLALPLRWLEVQTEPATELVVRHLLHAAARGESVNKEVWTFLNDHADDASLGELEGTACLYLDGDGYVEPQMVFWEHHDFGKRRFLAGDRFEAHRNLLNRLGVRRRPVASDAIAVLLEISGEASDETPLTDEDVQILAGCWRLLNRALDEHSIAEKEGLLDVGAAVIAALAAERVVADANGIVRAPMAVFLRDSESLARLFSGAVLARFIPRVEGIWGAQRAAGVVALSDALELEPLDEDSLPFGGLLPIRLDERRALLRRVFSHFVGDADRPLDLIDGLELRRNAKLRVRHRLVVDGDEYTSVDHLVRAHFEPTSGVLRWTEPDGASPGWLEIAKELSRAVGADDSIVLVLEKVLGAGSVDDCEAALDVIGVPALEADDIGAAPPAKASDFGGDDAAATSDDGGDGGEHLADEDVITGEPETPKDPTEDVSTSSAQDEGGLDEPPSTEPGEGGRPETENTTPGGGAPRGGTGADGSGDGSSGGRSGSGDSGTGSRSGTGGQSGAPSGSDGSRSRRSGDEGPQSRMLSYVRRSGATDPAEKESNRHRAEVDKAAVEAVLRHEREAGRSAVPMEHHNPGYDIESTDSQGSVRHIEVKGTATRWAERGVAITRTQFLHGKRLDDAFWLYVVEHATTNPVVHAIQNPMAQITRYVFDGGWRESAEHEHIDPGIDRLHWHPSPDGLANPAAVHGLGFETGELTIHGYLDLEEPIEANVSLVRIEDEGLGIAMRGGLAFVRPLVGLPPDDERVAVVVADDDERSGRRILVRLWASTGDATDNDTLVDLSGTGSAESVLLRLDEVEVIGVVEQIWRVDELAERGLLIEDED